jgi:hypothetical protein
MTRLEVIANRSVQEDVVEALGKAVAGLEYTVIPVAHGVGARAKKLGTPVWPEENFVLIAYIERAEPALRALRALKDRFSTEGITYFTVRAE